MTAVVSRERAKATYLTGVTGVLLLAVAFVMMVVAAPVQAHHRPHGATTPSAYTVSWIAQSFSQAISRGTPRR
jgi:hypothetical protein